MYSTRHKLPVCCMGLCPVLYGFVPCAVWVCALCCTLLVLCWFVYITNLCPVLYITNLWWFVPWYIANLGTNAYSTGHKPIQHRAQTHTAQGTNPYSTGHKPIQHRAQTHTAQGTNPHSTGHKPGTNPYSTRHKPPEVHIGQPPLTSTIQGQDIG